MHPLIRSAATAALPAFSLALACAAARHDASTVYPTSAGAMRLTTVARGLEHPWALEFLPDGRMLVTERPGRIRIVEKDGTLGAPLANVPEVFARGQGGMLDVALHPDFATNRTIYFSYSEPGDPNKGEGDAGTAVARARLGDGRLEDVQVIFRMQPKVSGAGHFGSRIVFADDGRVFVTLGERQHRERSQLLNEHLGKVVRIEQDGSVPKDNPFVGRQGVLPEIWSYGHRNVQGAALHPETRALWTVEHGARGGDEVNIPQPGRNYGWPVITYGRDYSGAKIGEGTAKEGMEQPVHYWDPSIAPGGMTFYTGDRYPGWKGDLFVGSMKFGLVSRLDLDGSKVGKEERLFEGYGRRIRDIVQGPDGYLYFVTGVDDGEIVRIEPATGT